jgi:acyl carrier protein
MATPIPRTDPEVFLFVKGVLVREFELDEVLVLPTAGLEDLDLDSIDAVDLAIAVEEEFGLKFTSEDIDGFRTLQDVVNVIVSAPPPQPA